MTSSTEVLTADAKNTKPGLGRWQGIALFGIVFASLAAAILVKYFDWVPSATTNKGTILKPPLQMAELGLVDTDGQDLLASGSKWRLLIPYRQNCGESCDQNLYITRQVHIRLADKAARVERTLLVFDDIGQSKSKLLAEHPRMRFANIDQAKWQQFIAQTNAPKDSIAASSYFLVDQRGYLMMFYNQEHTGNELLKDLKYLLKISYEGKQ